MQPPGAAIQARHYGLTNRPVMDAVDTFSDVWVHTSKIRECSYESTEVAERVCVLPVEYAVFCVPVTVCFHGAFCACMLYLCDSSLHASAFLAVQFGEMFSILSVHV
ncbi:hypothetical protein E2C01_022190 [Portunus trituberculatus]|uniref:Uncharacterized protein n=1 Tax=Portunus trituberculatus TaxID=210409 RepID=A0A5B7E704_PORTR|nr:hypothetical protein [Portunus trituberculatus]